MSIQIGCSTQQLMRTHNLLGNVGATSTRCVTTGLLLVPVVMAWLEEIHAMVTVCAGVCTENPAAIAACKQTQSCQTCCPQLASGYAHTYRSRTSTFKASSRGLQTTHTNTAEPRPQSKPRGHEKCHRRAKKYVCERDATRTSLAMLLVRLSWTTVPNTT